VAYGGSPFEAEGWALINLGSVASDFAFPLQGDVLDDEACDQGVYGVQLPESQAKPTPASRHTATNTAACT